MVTNLRSKLTFALLLTFVTSVGGTLAFAQDKDWAKKFNPSNPPAEYSDHSGQSSYFQSACNDLILPQWQASPDIDSALIQMESLMGQIGAQFVRQEDISWGYATYYYKTNNPVAERLSRPGAPFFYLTSENPRSIPHPDLREAALPYKQRYKLDPGGVRVLAMPNGLTQVMFPVMSGQVLSQYETLPDLKSELKFMPKMFQVSQMGYPQQWDYQSSERRDHFRYYYAYPLDAPSLSDYPKPAYGSILLHLDGRRTADGKLQDIVIRDVVCNFPNKPSGPSPYSGDAPALAGVRPRNPIVMQDCRAYKNWYECHFNPRYGVNEKFCSRFSKEGPVCENSEN